MIKKVTLMIALVAIITSVSFGQIKFGVKAGLNLSNVKMSGNGITVTNKMRTGFMIGGFAVYNFNDKLSIQPELLFAQYGCKLDADMWMSDSDIDVKENYISIPVMLNYSLGAITLQAGPQLGYLISAKIDTDLGGDSETDYFETLDFGLSVGAAYELENGLGFGARYYLGLANIGKEYFIGSGTVKNNAFQIMVSYKIK